MTLTDKLVTGKQIFVNIKFNMIEKSSKQY